MARVRRVQTTTSGWVVSTEDGGRRAMPALRATALWLCARVPAHQVGNHGAADAGDAQVEPGASRACRSGCEVFEGRQGPPCPQQEEEEGVAGRRGPLGYPIQSSAGRVAPTCGVWTTASCIWTTATGIWTTATGIWATAPGR
jgi:hypothetical protein